MAALFTPAQQDWIRDYVATLQLGASLSDPSTDPFNLLSAISPGGVSNPPVSVPPAVGSAQPVASSAPSIPLSQVPLGVRPPSSLLLGLPTFTSAAHTFTAAFDPLAVAAALTSHTPGTSSHPVMVTPHIVSTVVAPQHSQGPFNPAANIPPKVAKKY